MYARYACVAIEDCSDNDARCTDAPEHTTLDGHVVTTFHDYIGSLVLCQDEPIK